MTIALWIAGAGAGGFAVVAIVTLFLLLQERERSADLRIAAATSAATAQRERADRIAVELAAAERARQAAEDAHARTIADAADHDGLLDPGDEWDRRVSPPGTRPADR